MWSVCVTLWVVCNRKLKLLKQKENGRSSVPLGVIDPRSSVSLHLLTFLLRMKVCSQDLYDGLFMSSRKLGRVSLPPRIHTKASCPSEPGPVGGGKQNATPGQRQPPKSPRPGSGTRLCSPTQIDDSYEGEWMLGGKINKHPL